MIKIELGLSEKYSQSLGKDIKVQDFSILTVETYLYLNLDSAKCFVILLPLPQLLQLHSSLIWLQLNYRLE